MTVKVSPLVHIEIVVPDAEEAYQFLHRVLGAEKTQEEMASFLNNSVCPDGQCKCIHVELGGVVLQLVQPASTELPSWYEQLKQKGPGVHNLTFGVDNLERAVKILESEGAPVIQKIDLDWDRVYGPGKVRPSHPPVHIVDTMKNVGFRLELFEEPSL